MTKLNQVISITPKVQAITDEVLAKNIGREQMVRAAWLSLISGNPAFFLGEPGLNKTGTVQALARRIDGAVFYDALMPTVVSVEQFLVESTSIEEVPTGSGGKEIRVREQLGRAAKAHIVFADEIWKAEPRVLQTVLDLAKGGGVRHEGAMIKTPLLAFIAASNEMPEPEGKLGAMWSRMTIRAMVEPLGAGGKREFIKARLARKRQASSGSAQPAQKLTMQEVELLRQAWPFVTVSDEIVEQVLEIYQALRDKESENFEWLWADDRRFGRVFDILQANALLDGRDTVSRQDLKVLNLLLWDDPEQIPAVVETVAPYCRTPLSEAEELVDALLSPDGVVAEVKSGNRDRMLEAITQIEECEKELARLVGEASGSEVASIEQLLQKVANEKQVVVNAALGTKFKVSGGQ